MAKLTLEGHTAVSVVAVAAVLAGATEVAHSYAPPWCPDDKYASQLLFDVITSRSILPGPVNDSHT